MSYANVAIDVPLKRLFTYKIPKGMDVVSGSRVIVPFRNRTVCGFVAEIASDDGPKEFSPKEIIEAPDELPALSKNMLELLKWISDYYCAPIGEVFRAALPPALSKRPAKKRAAGVFKETEIDGAFLSAPEHELIKEQQEAFELLKSHILGGTFKTTLLHGVTGSGKTEVYLKIFADVLAKGMDAILLVPEIGLTPQSVGRVTARFGDKVAVYNSSLGDAKRLYEWRRMRDGEAKIVIGTRSAVFAPFKNLGIIVVDEEHDSSYKQDESPRYNGRDVAVMRAKIENVPCLLGSATPSLESFCNAKKKKYHYIHLPFRPTGAVLPEVDVVDMKEVQKGANLSPQLVNAISETLGKKEQVMLFLNRRGFASFVMCRDCGHTHLCPNCNITLTVHGLGRALLCHYCDYRIKSLPACAKCGSGRLEPLGTGTEKVESEINSFFPGARVARMDRDSVVKNSVRSGILSKMKSGGLDILVGTQMITKGHDFPNVTLVGVVDADMALNFPDFRASERTFQLITQVAGRAGRAGSAGRVVIQTHSPEHYAVLSAGRHDFFEFYGEEAPRRAELNYPPFGKLVLVRVQGAKENEVENFAQSVAMEFQRAAINGISVLGPTPAPLNKIRGKFRWHVLLKAGGAGEMRRAIPALQAFEKAAPRGVKVIVDVDPINML